jgi:hypothetical protein
MADDKGSTVKVWLARLAKLREGGGFKDQSKAKRIQYSEMQLMGYSLKLEPAPSRSFSLPFKVPCLTVVPGG